MTTPNPEKALSVSEYIRKPEQMALFVDLLGEEAKPYVQSVLIAVSNSDDLLKCTPNSVTRSALRAASLGLSCDPAVKQAWLVPYNRNVGTKQSPQWIKEAQFQPHYLGLRTLAMRTGKYWTINVSPVYDNQRVLYNPLTGLHAVVEDNGFVGEPKSYNAAYVDVTAYNKNQKRRGWIAYYKAKNGEEKSVYMSVEEIEEHARKYVKEYEKNQNWQDPDKRATMEAKTVLKKLLSWADMTGKAGEQLKEALRADAEQAEPEPFIDASVTDY